MTSSSSHSPYVFGTGTSVFSSAVITLYSLSTAWADGSKTPGGFLLKTNSFLSVAILYVGFDCPPLNWAMFRIFQEFGILSLIHYCRPFSLNFRFLATSFVPEKILLPSGLFELDSFITEISLHLYLIFVRLHSMHQKYRLQHQLYLFHCPF